MFCKPLNQCQVLPDIPSPTQPYFQTDHLFTVSLPSVSTVISFASAGMGLVVVLPPGHRIQIRVGVSGQPMTCTTLSCDQ